MLIIGKLEGIGNSLFYISAHLKLFKKKKSKSRGGKEAMSFMATASSEHSYNLLTSESRAQVYHLFSHTRQKLGISVVHPWWRNLYPELLG